MASSDRELRLTMRVLGYWRSLLNGGRFPRRAQIDGTALGDDWLRCFIVQPARPPERSTFLYVGRHLCFPIGSPMDGRTIAECARQTVLHAATSYIGRVLEKQVPISIGGLTVQGGADVLYRSILLPLSDAGESIDALLGAASFREATTGEQEFSV